VQIFSIEKITKSTGDVLLKKEMPDGSNELIRESIELLVQEVSRF